MSNFSNSIGNVINKIYEVRGEKIMLDNDLAQLYGVRTNQLREAVRKNMARFPEDFMFKNYYYVRNGKESGWVTK